MKFKPLVLVVGIALAFVSCVPTTSDVNAVKAKIWLNSREFKVGDTAVIHIKAESDAYICIYDNLENEPTVLLYPFESSERMQSFVKGGEEVLIPSKYRSFTFMAGSPSDYEELIVVTNSFDYCSTTYPGSYAGKVSFKITE